MKRSPFTAWDILASTMNRAVDKIYEAVFGITMFAARNTNRNVSYWTNKVMGNPIMFFVFFRVLPVVAFYLFMRRGDVVSAEGLVSVLLLVIMFSIARE